MMNTTLTAPLIDIVEAFRLEKGYNLWVPDMLYMDMIYIWLEWDQKGRVKKK